MHKYYVFEQTVASSSAERIIHKKVVVYRILCLSVLKNLINYHSGHER